MAWLNRWAPVLLLGTLLAPVSYPAGGFRHTSPASHPLPRQADFGRLPLSFELNRGQTDSRVRFLSHGPGYNLFLTRQGAVLSSRGAVDTGSPESIRIRLAGQSERPVVTGMQRLAGTANYFLGNDPRRWRTNIPTYARVRYAGVYPGIDEVFYGNRGRLEYDLVVKPHARPDRIRLSFLGAKRLSLDRSGNLHIGTRRGDLIQHPPVVYQERDGRRTSIAGKYVLADIHRSLSGAEVSLPDVRFRVGRYDVERPLVIDPVLVYSTWLGGSGGDSAAAVTISSQDLAYVTGPTLSTDFPVLGPSGPYQATSKGHPTVFVSKFNAAGSALLYSTYIGGSNGDIPQGLTIDGDGNAYVAGVTYSTDYPTATPSAQTHVFQNTKNGYSDAFLTKLAPNGNALVYSTYFGGSGVDYARGVAVDSQGDAYLAGSTFSTDLPTTTGAFQRTLAGTDDAFVAKFDPTGSVLPYSTYVGGTATDETSGIALDAAGHAFVTGFTYSGDFPMMNPFQGGNGGAADAFVFELNSTGTGLLYSTYLGGSDNDFAFGITLDRQGSFAITGHTFSVNLPTLNAFQPHLAPYPYGGTGCDAFVTRFQPGGAGLVYSTYLGGNLDDEGKGIAVDRSGNIWVTGVTYARNACSGDPVPNTPPFPTLNPFQATRGGLSCVGGAGKDDLDDAFVSAFDKNGVLLFSTYFGGTALDDGTGVALDSDGNAFVVGETASPDFPTKNPAFPFKNDFDAYLAKWTGYPQPPGAPTKLVATAVSSTEIDLSWVDGSSNEAGFSVQWMPPGASSFTQLGTAPAVTGTGSTIKGKAIHLAPLSTYSFRIAASNSAGTSDFSNVATATTFAAGPPPKIRVSPTKINFGASAVNPPTPPKKSFTIKNIGGQSLTGSVGSLSAPFSVFSGGGAFSLAKNQSVTVTLQFSPTATGAVSPHTLAVTSNDTSHATVNVTVTGKVKH